MDDKREFDNPFEDYMPNIENNVIDKNDRNKIHASLQGKLQKTADQLLDTLDAKWRRASDKDRDYSIYTGSTGIALLYYHIAESQHKKPFIKLAAELVDSVLPRLKGRRLSLLTGDAGPLAVGAAIHNHLGAKDTALGLCHRLKGLLPQALDLRSDLPDEVLYGRAGFLLALLFIKHNVGEDAIENRAIQQVVAAIISSGKSLAQASNESKDGGPVNPPLMFKWHGKKYLGAAHGLCGILCILIQSHNYLPQEKQEELASLICPTIDYLLGLSFPSGNLPSSVGNDTDRLVHWCHGAPGFVAVLCLANKVYNCPRYLEAAVACGDVVWQRGLLKKGCGICHGVAGNAYVFFQLYQATTDLKHLYRGLRFAEWCADYSKHQTRTPDRPLSLYEGLAGTIYFLIDVQKPMSALFPAYVV